MTTFLLQMMEDESHFLLLEHTPKLTKLRMYVTPGKTFYELLSMGISTTRWHYNQGKCILAYNSHILYRTFKNLISTRSRSMPISALIFFFFAKCRKPIFSNSSQAISPICTKLCTQHLWTLLTKMY